MNRRIRTRARQDQINILHTTTRKRHSRRQVLQVAVWCSLVLAMIVAVGAGLQFGINLMLAQVLYNNPRYALNKIEVEPRGHFTDRVIRRAAGLETGQNLWTLNLRQIAHDLEKLPNVSSATVERHFPDRITIQITERVPVVKIVGINSDLGTRETFYLDRECVVLKPRADESVPLLPEVIGLTDDELDPGAKLEQPRLARAMEILDAIDHTTLHTAIDIRTIDLGDPLCIKMVTTRDMTITFLPDYVDQQLIRLKEIFDYADKVQRTLRTVDLTPACNVPITFYD